MDWRDAAVVGATLLVLGGLGFWRRRSLKPVWAWNDVAIQLLVGGQLHEVFVAEVCGVLASDGQLAFETSRGYLTIDSRWVEPRAVAMLAAACALPEDDVRRALETAGRTDLWRGQAGSLRLPPMS